MNTYLKMQIENMKVILSTFQQSCEMATLQDDGVMSKQEEKQLKKIKEAAKEFTKQLNQIE